AFLRRAGRAIWAEERDLADRAVIAELSVTEGLPAELLLTAAEGEASAGRYETNRIEAIAAGVFGAPSYVLDGEVFWGQDRIELLDQALASGRAAYLPQA
ncbi:MAG: DsbA family protein, partial [Porphyrobacter sp.]|nr:DsbA family protein [Porphyrobacter sp.]